MLILDPNILPATEKDLVALARYWRKVEEGLREKRLEERAARGKKAVRARRKRVRKQKTVLARKRRAAGR